MKTPALPALAGLLLACALLPGPAGAQALCEGYGPQSPRDIASPAGANPRIIAAAPPAGEMNLCNLHFHAQAEHKGPGFAVFAGPGAQGGFRCAESGTLSAAELAPPQGGGVCGGVKPGDTIEVHWVYTSCAATPGQGLGACRSETCANPQLRVEAQAFLLVNDPAALDFADFAYDGGPSGALHQPRGLPEGTGTPVVYAGSVTSPRLSETVCSPLQVTWSVRPACARLDIASLDRWCAANPFGETKAHGVRTLVTAPELLSRIE